MMNTKFVLGRSKQLFAGMVMALLSMSVMADPVVIEGATISSRLEMQGSSDSLVVTDLRAIKRNNLLRIQAEVTNSNTANQQLYYRFRWLDSDGFVVWDDEPWKPVLVYGKQKRIISTVSPTFKATDFRLVLHSSGNAAN